MNRFANESKQEWLDRISEEYELEIDFVKSLTQDYMNDTSQNLELLKEITHENMEEAQIAAHNIKGSSASLGQHEISDAAKCIEKQLKSGSIVGIEEKVKLLKSTYDQFKDFAAD